jgi:hypothetical protein
MVRTLGLIWQGRRVSELAAQALLSAQASAARGAREVGVADLVAAIAQDESLDSCHARRALRAASVDEGWFVEPLGPASSLGEHAVPRGPERRAPEPDEALGRLLKGIDRWVSATGDAYVGTLHLLAAALDALASPAADAHTDTDVALSPVTADRLLAHGSRCRHEVGADDASFAVSGRSADRPMFALPPQPSREELRAGSVALRSSFRSRLLAPVTPAGRQESPGSLVRTRRFVVGRLIYRAPSIFTVLLLFSGRLPGLPLWAELVGAVIVMVNADYIPFSLWLTLQILVIVFYPPIVRVLVGVGTVAELVELRNLLMLKRADVADPTLSLRDMRIDLLKQARSYATQLVRWQ